MEKRRVWFSAGLPSETLAVAVIPIGVPTLGLGLVAVLVKVEPVIWIGMEPVADVPVTVAVTIAVLFVLSNVPEEKVAVIRPLASVVVVAATIDPVVALN